MRDRETNVDTYTIFKDIDTATRECVFNKGKLTADFNSFFSMQTQSNITSWCKNSRLGPAKSMTASLGDRDPWQTVMWTSTWQWFLARRTDSASLTTTSTMTINSSNIALTGKMVKPRLMGRTIRRGTFRTSTKSQEKLKNLRTFPVSQRRLTGCHCLSTKSEWLWTQTWLSEIH